MNTITILKSIEERFSGDLDLLKKEGTLISKCNFEVVHEADLTSLDNYNFMAESIIMIYSNLKTISDLFGITDKEIDNLLLNRYDFTMKDLKDIFLRLEINKFKFKYYEKDV